MLLEFRIMVHTLLIAYEDNQFQINYATGTQTYWQLLE
jgi:hypothetical protein